MKAHAALAAALLAFASAGCTENRGNPVTPLEGLEPRPSVTPGETFEIRTETREWRRPFGQGAYTDLYDVTYSGGQVQVVVEQPDGSVQNLGTMAGSAVQAFTAPTTGRVRAVAQPYPGCYFSWEVPYGVTEDRIYLDEYDGWEGGRERFWVVFYCYA